MFVNIYLCLFVSVCHARGVCRANQQSFWDANVGDVILACQRESLSGIGRANQQNFGTSTMGDVTIPRIMTEKPRCRKPPFYGQTVVIPRSAE